MAITLSQSSVECVGE